jgi:hypothetical protein
LKKITSNSLSPVGKRSHDAYMAGCCWISSLFPRQEQGITLMNDNEPPLVWVIVGRITRRKGGPESDVHVLLQAPDEDSAVRLTLNGLQQEGFAEAQLDQIGEMEEEPDEEPYLSAYQGALEGEVAIVMV